MQTLFSFKIFQIVHDNKKISTKTFMCTFDTRRKWKKADLGAYMKPIDDRNSIACVTAD